MEDYSKQVLRVVVAQVCQAIGWHGIQSTPLELLTDILHKYMQELSVRTFRYTQLYSRTEANLDDVGLAFRDVGIIVPELLDYINNVDSVPCAVDVPRFPIKKDSNLNFLKPGRKEVIIRPVHVHEHLPPIHPEKEDDSSSPQEQSAIIPNPVHANSDPSTVITDITSATANTVNIINNNKAFKKPEMSDITHSSKKARSFHEDEGRPTREISSVMMTSSGFISPAREGKLPDSKAPIIPESKPIEPKTPPQAVKAASVVGVLSADTATSANNVTEIKQEKKSKKQKSLGPAVATLEVKEQRKRERHLSKFQKRRGDNFDRGKTPNKKPRIRESKAKRHPINTFSTGTSAGSTLELTLPLEPFPSVSLPADLTIKSETVPIIPSSISNHPLSAFSIENSVVSNTLLTGIDMKPNVSHEIKLSSAPDKQKYNIFKKISAKKSREENLKVSGGNFPNDLYSGFPTLPESTTIRRLPAMKFDSPPHTDPNVIVVDDDTPPRPSSPFELSGTQPLSFPSLPAGTTATTSAVKTPYFENSLINIQQLSKTFELTKKQQRKPRKNKQQVLLEQSAPLNLSNESTVTKDFPLPDNLHVPEHTKAPRKRLNKVGRPSKRNNKMSGLSDNQNFSQAMGLPSMSSDNLKRDLSPLGMFKGPTNQFLPGMHRYPYINPFHLLGGPGLIPNPSFMHPSGNPLLAFRNPFGYSDLMGLRPPLRPPKVDEKKSISPPPPIPLDLENNVYCNVPPLVPDSMKLQLSPALLSRGSKLSSSSAITSPTSKDSFNLMKGASKRMEPQNFGMYHAATPLISTKQHKVLDAPIEISDDEKSLTKSDTEIEKPVGSPGLSNRNSNNNAVTSSTCENVSSHGKTPNVLRTSEINTAVEVSHDTENFVEINLDRQADVNLREQSSNEANTLDVSPEAAIPNLPKGEKRRDKEHKKGKRGKDGKIKKKKDKKDKTKSKEKADKRKEDKKEKDRNKKKKEKRKEKLRGQPDADAATKLDKPTLNNSIAQPQDATSAPTSLPSSMVPKLTLKFGSPDSVASDESPETKNAKSLNEGDDIAEDGPIKERRESSPELARISPLVTRPPKQKVSTKEKNSDNEQQAGAPSLHATPSNGSSTNPASSKGLGRASKNQNTVAVAVSSQEQAPPALSSPAANTAGITPINSTESIINPAGDSKSSSETQPIDRGLSCSSANTTSANSLGLRSNAKVTGTLTASGSASKQTAADPTDAEGNQVWICPACGKVDDGTPMIGCDGCDAWYHWVCVGIQVPPDECEDWYCRNCIIKKQEANYYDKKKKRKKKNKAN